MTRTAESDSSLRRWTLLRLCAALVVGSFVAPGCAALTIDVDVYKGPLVNEPALQVEQVAALCDVAFPFLVDLRDRLEWGPDSDGMYKSAPWYARRGIDPICYGHPAPLGNPKALRVNEILSLYEDTRSPFSGPVARVKAEVDAYVSVWDQYRPDGSLRAIPTSLPFRAIALAEKLAASRTKANVGDLELRGAYVAFLNPLSSDRLLRDEEPLLLHGMRVETESVFDAQGFLPASAPAQGETPGERLRRISSANARFIALSRLAPLHAARLFTDPAEQGEFQNVVRSLAGAFLSCRDHHHATLIACLKLLEAIAADVTQDPAAKTELIRETTRQIVRLIEPAYLRAALDSQPVEPSLQNLLSSWNSGFTDSAQFNFAVRISSFDFDSASTALEKAISADVATAVRAIREADARCRNAPLRLIAGSALSKVTVHWKDAKTMVQYLEVAHRLDYGLAGAPTSERERQPQLISELLMALDQFASYAASTSSSGLNGSRPVLGLKSLIRGYREAAFAAGQHADLDAHVADARKRALDALAAFGSRVAGLGNDDALERSQSGSGFFSGIANAFNPGRDSDLGDKTNEDYRTLLQAIGNTIVAHVDNIAARGRWDEAKRNAGDMKQVLNGMVEAPNLKSESLAGLENEIRLRLVAEKAKLAEAQSAGRTDKLPAIQASVATLESTVKTVKSIRQDVAFIRPASSYLRAAFPATAVQNGGQIGWNNMLLDQAGHIEPFNLLTPDGARFKQLMQEEVDRQSWQTINQISVSASGDTTYALVKDDIGNWYVKGFSGDPKPIIEGAQGIALGAYAARTGIDAYSVAEGKMTPEQAAAESTEARQLKALRDRYAAAARSDLEELEREYGALAQRIFAEWSSSPAIQPNLDLAAARRRVAQLHQREFGAWQGAIPARNSIKTSEAIRSLHEGFGSMRRFSDAARAAVVEATPDAKGDAAVAARASAQRVVAAEARDVVGRLLARREGAKADASTAAGVLFPASASE